MFVRSVLRHKGSDVVSVQETDTIATVADVLVRWRIGAVLVRDAEGQVAGILSERDVVGAMAKHRDRTLALPARDLMVRHLITCGPDDSIEDIMVLMTERRIRHLPVMDDGRLIGLISIGDVVKSRIAEFQSETEALKSYITAA